MQKLVYSFNEGSQNMQNLLGDKGANLSEMTKVGLRVPFGFIVTTEACNLFYAEGRKLSENLITEIEYQMEVLENVAGKKFGDRENPLLVSVRSGAVISMDGTLDTILNLGLNDEIAEGLAEASGNPYFAYDSYLRFIEMYGDVVLDIPKACFTAAKEQQADADAGFDVETNIETMKATIKAYKALVYEHTGKPFPEDPKEQLLEAIKALLCSWMHEDAVSYRKEHGLTDQSGMAVNVQKMVFGNLNDASGTGAVCTRNPSNGERELFGTFVLHAQGEEMLHDSSMTKQIAELEEILPDAYHDLQRIAAVMEKYFKDMQDIEFTIENHKLYILQTRTAKRTAECAIHAAVNMVEEGLISKETAVNRMDVNQIAQLLHPAFDHDAERRARILAKGLPASPGAASGKIFFSGEAAVAAAEQGIKVILVRQETFVEDLAGMTVAEGILTSKGGMTSHAAVVARGMGKCCVSGCNEAIVDETLKTLTIGETVLDEGDSISLNGTMGHIYFGEVKNVETAFSEEFNQIMSWADDLRALKIRANADNPRDARQALEFGAEGIGLCRTEHMFFEEERIILFRQMIMAGSEEGRRKALEQLLPYQKSDFKQIYEVMGDMPVKIRLLDPPLHEFLPQTDAEMQELSAVSGISMEELARTAEELREYNPMLGQRGCRLAIIYPEIVEMQTRAILEAAIEVMQEQNIVIVPEIMIPFVGLSAEFSAIKAVVKQTIEACKKEYELDIDYFVGTMIEVPRAALTAGELAKEADFFSFGTNDLTQMVFGFSRDDTGGLIKSYVEKGILEDDPFQTIDQKGVGALMETAAKQGKQARANLKLGICGEQGGDPRSIDFCHRIGLHYVSCSPFRIPVARIAAAQAVIHNRKE